MYKFNEGQGDLFSILCVTQYTGTKKDKTPKRGKSTDSDLAHLLDIIFCHQNQTK